MLLLLLGDSSLLLSVCLGGLSGMSCLPPEALWCSGRLVLDPIAWDSNPSSSCGKELNEHNTYLCKSQQGRWDLGHPCSMVRYYYHTHFVVKEAEIQRGLTTPKTIASKNQRLNLY